MRTLTAALLAQQVKSSGIAAAQVIIDDRYCGVFRPRWTLLSTDTVPDGPSVIGAGYDGAIIRAYANPATGKLYSQRVTNPDELTQWRAWSQISSGLSATTQIALAYDGLTALVLCYVLADNRTIQAITSLDSGGTWSAPDTITTLAAGHVCTGLAATLNIGLGTLYVIYCDEPTNDATCYVTTRDEESGSWTAPVAWDQPGANCYGLAVWGYGFHLRIVAAVDNSLGLHTLAIGDTGTWGVSNQFCNSDNNAISYRWPHISPGFMQHYYLFSIEHDTATGTDRPQHHTSRTLTSASLLPRPYNIAAAYGLCSYSDGTYHYLCTSRYVYRAAAWTPTAAQRIDVSDDVLSIRLTEHLDDVGQLVITLRNNDGRYASELGSTTYQAIKRGSQISTRLGYSIQGTDEVSYYRPFWVTAIIHHRAQSESTLELQATDGWGVLAQSHTRQARTWTSATVLTILTDLLQGLGFDVTDDSNAAWSTVITTFTITPATSVAAAVKRLLTIAGGSLIFHVIEQWEDTWPSASALLTVLGTTSAYTIGTTHAIRSADIITRDQEATHIIATSDSARGEALDWTSIDVINADRVATTIDQRLADTAAAESLAASILTQAERSNRQAKVTMPPHVGLECGDIVTLVETITATNAAYLVLDNQVTLDKLKGTYSQTLVMGAP